MKKTLLFLLIAPFALSAQNFWTEVSPFTGDAHYNVRDISIVNENVIWVSGQGDYPNNNPKWSRSTDGGLTWQEGNITINNIADAGIGSFHAVSVDRAYVAVFPSTSSVPQGVWVTTDGGITWTQQLGQNWTNDMFPNFVHFWNANDGIVVCDPIDGQFQIYTTTNAGVNWNLVPAENIPAPLDGEYAYTRNFDYTNGNFWFGTNKGRLFYTNVSNLSNGLLWQAYQTPLTDFGSAVESGSYAFKNQNEGLLITNTFGLWRTLNSGASWNDEVPTGIHRNYTLTYVTGTMNSYFCTGEDIDQSGRGSSYTTDGGHTWIDLNDADQDPVFPDKVAFASGTVGFCVGAYVSDMAGTKHFFRMTDPMNRLLKTDNFTVNSKFTAVPNPTSGMVKLNGQGITSVSVCDISGKAIVTQNYNAVTEATLDLSAFQNGIYFAKVDSDNGAWSNIKIVKN